MDLEEAWCPTELDDFNNTIEGALGDTFGNCEPTCQPGKPNKNITVKTTDDKHWSRSTSFLVTISVCLLLFILSVITFYYFHVKRRKEKGSVETINLETILNGNPAMMNSEMILNEQASHLSYSGKYEMDRSQFELGRKLGGGAFGSVHQGVTEDFINSQKKTKVAIKSVNNPLDPSQIHALMCEIKVLDKLEMRLDLVNMVGACTTKVRTGELWLLLEFCPHGDLKNFLLKNRDIILQDIDNEAPHKTLNSRLFIKWSHSISKGMEYLSSKNIMHGDLAARNILIGNFNHDEQYLAKICDFGLAKAFYDQTSYEKEDRNQVPWKWMDINYYTTGKFTMSSDVWSFGVVFWEMLSMGQIPYAGGSANDTIKEIKAGFRLPVPDEIFKVQWLVKCYKDVAKMCWQLDPKQRWKFSDVVKNFDAYLTTEEKEQHKRLEQSVVKVEKRLSQKRISHRVSNEYQMDCNDQVFKLRKKD